MNATNKSALIVRNIQKRFGSQTALSRLDLEIKKGEFFSLLGPSGCGKSTLLRILAGLETATEGEIWWEGRRIDGLPARERPFNMVFQKYALFPHLSVSENVAFGLNLKSVPRSEVRDRVAEVLELVNLKGFEARLPETLSGGQAQRVALARALVNRPACVLLDEPLTALDQKLREHMQTELRLLQRRLGLTFIFVTHDQEEAMLMSDRVAVMNEGRVEQVSEPRDLYESPASIFSARFIGRRNELAAEVVRVDSGWADLNLGRDFTLRGRASPELDRATGTRPETRSETRSEARSEVRSEVRSEARVFVRPERLNVLTDASQRRAGSNVIEGEIVQVLFRGVHTELIVALTGQIFIRAFIEVGQNVFRPGDRTRFEFMPDDTHVFFEAST